MSPVSRSLARHPIILIALGVLCLAQAAAGEKYAMLIGISNYDIRSIRTGVVPLQYADDDAITMKELLGKQYKVRELVNEKATREEILKEFARLQEIITEDDTFLLFFAGHGVRDPNNGKTYWLAFDTRLDLIEAKGIRLEHLFDYVSELKAKEKIVLLDHCFSGDIAYPPGSTAATRASIADEVGIKRGVFRSEEINAQFAARAEGVVFLAAARDAAFESKNLGHGLFTEALRRSLTTRQAEGPNGDGLLSLSEMIKYVAEEVDSLADQENVKQKLVTFKRDVKNDHNWSPLFKLPPKGSEAEQLRDEYVRVLTAWRDNKWITLETLIECQNSLRLWVEFRQAESVADRGTNAPRATLDARTKSMVDDIREHVELVARRPDMVLDTATQFQASFENVPK